MTVAHNRPSGGRRPLSDLYTISKIKLQVFNEKVTHIMHIGVENILMHYVGAVVI